MSEKNVRVRFAPSPTGDLHIGGARTALFNYLFAKNTGGKFLLRVEDTDKKRSSKEAIDAILQGLEWLGLKRDEVDIFQSQNLSRHQEVINSMVKKGAAYRCFTSSVELQNLRENSGEKNAAFRFQSPFRDLSEDESQNLAREKPFVIRLKVPKDQTVTINDAVHGELSISSNEVDDLILLRADGTPTYMPSVVIDDHDMQISHILRGDDHLTNSYKQKVIFESLDWDCPEFIHIPLIHGADGAKMSKRHGATSVIEYKKMGYLPVAVRSYLLRLGFSSGDKEIINDEEAATIFNLSGLGKSPSRFDFAKLGNLNKHYIKELTEEELLEEITQFLDAAPNTGEKERLVFALKFLKAKPATLKEIADSCSCYFDNSLAKFAGNFDDSQRELLTSKQDLLAKISSELSSMEIWNHDSIKTSLMDFAKNNEIKIKDFGPALRLALTFSGSSAGGIFDVVEALGRGEVIKRISTQLHPSV